MRFAFFLISVLAAGSVLLGNQAPQPPLEEMQKLDFLVGEWSGTGSISFGPNRHESRVVERVQPKLGGAVLLVEGIGKSGAAGTPEERVVHNALGVISFDSAAKKYRMRAYRADGQHVDSDIQLEKRKLIWGYQDPRAGEIRYTIQINQRGQWFEIGEMSRDGGQTWQRFFEMTLDRLPPPAG